MRLAAVICFTRVAVAQDWDIDSITMSCTGWARFSSEHHAVLIVFHHRLRSTICIAASCTCGNGLPLWLTVWLHRGKAQRGDPSHGIHDIVTPLRDGDKLNW